MLNDQWINQRAGGAISNRSTRGVVTRPRVMLELDIRISDPTRYALAVGDQDPEQTIAWLKSIVMKTIEGYIGTRGLLAAMSGAYPIAEEATELANADLSPMGLEVAIKTLDLSLSSEDEDAVREDVDRANRGE
jgi:hypothetical protein